jgi:hypothetical protein
MSVYVCDDLQSGLSAERPEGRVARAVEDNNSRLKTVRIEIVVIHKAVYLPTPRTPNVSLDAKQECATFVFTGTAPR